MMSYYCLFIWIINNYNSLIMTAKIIIIINVIIITTTTGHRSE